MVYTYSYYYVYHLRSVHASIMYYKISNNVKIKIKILFDLLQEQKLKSRVFIVYQNCNGIYCGLEIGFTTLNIGICPYSYK